MKFLNLFVVLSLFIGLYACNKKDSSTDNISFNINGINDLKIPANGSGSLTLAITHTSGKQETVTLSLNGLPDKVSHEFSTASGTPTFNSMLDISADYATEGNYPITILAKSASGETKNYNFNLIIEPYTDCAAKMAGIFNGSVNCGGFPENETITITKNPGVVNGIFIEGIDGFPDKVPATLDCENQTISIPEFSFNNGVYDHKGSGTGTFVAPSVLNMTLNITRKVNGQNASPQNCTYTLAK